MNLKYAFLLVGRRKETFKNYKIMEGEYIQFGNRYQPNIYGIGVCESLELLIILIPRFGN